MKYKLKTAMAVAAGVGIYFAYQAIKKRIDDLEEEVWDMDEEELDQCPYCDKVYSIQDEEKKEDNELKEKVEEFNSRRLNCENCNDATPEEMEHYLNKIKDDKKNANIDVTDYVEGHYDHYDE